MLENDFNSCENKNDFDSDVNRKDRNHTLRDYSFNYSSEKDKSISN